MDKKALVVGIDHYERISPLHGCANDAEGVAERLKRNEDDTPNFDPGVKLLVARDETTALTRRDLKDQVEVLFAGDPKIALFYFAGHGHLEMTGGYLLTSECDEGDDGLPLSELITIANRSKAKNKIILLDSCHSGVAGSSGPRMSELGRGLTVMTASTAEQYATEENGSGLFTGLLLDGLDGAAANLLGEVTPGALYAHIDQSLGPWFQRPVFKTNIEAFVSLRRADPPIDRTDLQQIDQLFPEPNFDFELDPSFEEEEKGRDPGMPPPEPENVRRFKLLQKYNRVNLVVPVDAPYMWHAAMGSKSCRLTRLGEHYRRLRVSGHI